MLNFLKKEANITYTENGAVTYRSTENFCLDFFYKAGALRNADNDKIISAFVKAYTENHNLAMKILFFARDIRGGLGERKIFRICINWLALNSPDSVIKNIENIAEFGRYDELKKTVDKAKAKEYFEKVEGTKIIPPKVNVKVDKLLRDFIISGGYEIQMPTEDE